MMRLDVGSIKFGKFYKTHVCNLKEFKVFGGMTQDNMVELLYSGLRNDSEAETISIRQRLNGHYIPCQFIKIQPLLAYDQKFNFSIWHVELRGTIDAQIVQSIIDRFNQYKDEETIRSCLKFYRDRNYTSAFEALEKQTKLKLEAPILSNLREALVEKCNYTRVEQLLHEAERSSMFTSCAAKIPYAAKWELVESAVFTMPPGRGGHQMCVDEDSRIAYLYGGWD
ncbi:Muskelin 1, intracellular mediator containing kelch motif, partial [Coemansia sp. RSA 921]